ncbi:MAG: hypothetical protein N3D09_03895 [Archaeoglobaceae archaeon]|nr:hypothetical protein [Archaeoglobaceae archaeon]
MIWLIISVLTVFAYPGENVTITLAETSWVEISDSCLFFAETLNNSTLLPPGVHVIKVGVNCTPGIKFVTANNMKISEIMVHSRAEREKLLDYAKWLEDRLMTIKVEIESLKVEIGDVKRELNNTRSEKERIEKEKKLLELDLEKLNKQLANLTEIYNTLKSKYHILSDELERERDRIIQMESEIRSLTQQNTNYRIATFFLISIFVGSFTAMTVMIRRS